MFRLIVLCALVAQCATSNVSPVQKVVQMIEDMAVKVQKDLDSVGKEFEEYAKYCDDEATSTDYAIKSSNEQIEALSASVEDATAKISELESKVEDLSGSISDSEAELAKAQALRKKQNADFLASEKTMLETIDTLSGATETLKKSLELAQLTPDAKQGVDTLLSSLGKIVDADFVTHEERSKVRAFLQAQDDADDALTLTQTAAGSPAIIETLQGMTERAEGTLSDARKQEMEDAQSSALMAQGTETEIKSFQEELSESTKLKQFNVEAKAVGSKDLAVEKKGLGEDEKSLSDLKHACQERATQFEAETKDGQAELTALGKAKEILLKKFAAFVEVKTAVKASARDDDDSEDSRAKALRHVEQLGRKFHSTALVALAYRASADPFVKVRGMIEDMIEKLLQEAAEEATQKAFCDEEIGKSTKSQSEKEASLAKTQARIDKAESSVAKLTELVSTLSKEVADIDTSVADATAVRNKEKAAFVVAEKDFSESEEACAAAISVLREYYEGASLMQVHSEAAAKLTTKGDGSGILGLLEVAESDFAKLLAEARAIEEAAATEFSKMLEDNKLNKATKEMDIKGKQSELKSLKTSLADYGEDKEGVSSELSAVLAYLDKLKPQCETKVPTYEEIKAQREAEIQGLKEALDILAGDGIALVQTGRHLRALPRA